MGTSFLRFCSKSQIAFRNASLRSYPRKFSEKIQGKMSEIVVGKGYRLWMPIENRIRVPKLDAKVFEQVFATHASQIEDAIRNYHVKPTIELSRADLAVLLLHYPYDLPSLLEEISRLGMFFTES